MDQIWTASPATVRQIHEHLETATGWSYSTVKTLMARLVEKGVLTVERRGAANYFAPTASREEARQSALAELLDQAFNGAVPGLVQHLLRRRQLKPGELEQLRRLLAENESHQED